MENNKIVLYDWMNIQVNLWQAEVILKKIYGVSGAHNRYGDDNNREQLTGN